jgi:hypothetical protein
MVAALEQAGNSIQLVRTDKLSRAGGSRYSAADTILHVVDLSHYFLGRNAKSLKWRLLPTGRHHDERS